MDVIVKEEKQESKYANQLYLFSVSLIRKTVQQNNETFCRNLSSESQSIFLNQQLPLRNSCCQ